ncbi:MAG TPA: C45 family peptidase [Bacteroidota bacterium]|nr:C45 family peptidase [Bacteroidota bacterium]
MKSTSIVFMLISVLFWSACARKSPKQEIRPPAGVPGTASLSADQISWLSRAGRHSREGWVYLHCEGSPGARGFQHGYLMANEIRESLRITRAVWEYESGMTWAWLVAQAAPMFTPRIDAELLEELQGIADGLAAAGVQTSLEEMITYNAYVELSGYWWPEQKKKLDLRSPGTRKQSCSSFIATGRMTADGGIVLGHNTMCSYVVADPYVVLDIVPAKGHRILMQTSPGWIHSGTDFFITDGGIVGAETTIGSFSGFDESGVPEFVRMRRASQDASSIDGWCDIMRKGNNGGYANAWLVGDIKTNEIARLELGLKYVGFERTMDGYYCGSNVAENREILRLETDEHETDIRVSGVARRVRWHQLMKLHEGKITAGLAEEFEADHFDSYLRRTALSWRGLCAHGDCDSLDPGLPFEPGGTVDAKVVDATMARNMSFAARWGSGCGRPFHAEAFLAEHPQFDWMRGLLKDRGSYRWAVFTAGEK